MYLQYKNKINVSLSYFFQIALLASFLALGSCHYGPGPISEGYAHGPIEPELPAKYQFGYAVGDHKTGDFKSQGEIADGKSVKVR